MYKFVTKELLIEKAKWVYKDYLELLKETLDYLKTIEMA
jgi:hypothetical protein